MSTPSAHAARAVLSTHPLEDGTDLRTIQLLLGHRDLEDTTLNLHLSDPRLSDHQSVLSTS